jgi:hypothetical protein
VHAPSEEKSDFSKDSFCEELEQVFYYHFPKHHMKIVLEDYNPKLGREYIFLPTIGNEILHQFINDKEVRVVNFATSKNLAVKSTMLPHRNILKCNWTSRDGKAHKQIDHILKDWGWHSSMLDV